MKQERLAWLDRQVAQQKIVDPDDLRKVLRDAAALLPPGAKLAVALPLGEDVLGLFPPLWQVFQAIEYPATKDLCIRAVRTVAQPDEAARIRAVEDSATALIEAHRQSRGRKT